MYNQILTNFGLSEKEAHIYEILLKTGPITILALTKKAPYKRSDLYNILASLIAWGLLEIVEQNKKKMYLAVHPSKLEDMSLDQEREVQRNKKMLGDILPELTSLYHIGHNKPGIRYFEGKDGFKEALYDTLTAVESIYTFSNTEAVEQYMNDINKMYKKERERRGLHKKILMLDTPGNRERVNHSTPSKYTEIRFMPKKVFPFQTAMQIYNNKISYFTLRNDNLISVIIEDPDIYTMHRAFFEYFWDFVSKINDDDIVIQNKGLVFRS